MEFYIGQTFIEYPPPEAIVWINNNNCKLEQSGDIYTIVKIPKYVPTKEEFLKSCENAVQSHLDKIAQSRDYDNSYTCISYINSTNETWNKESNAFNSWRDSVWIKYYEILDDYKAGKFPQLTVDQIISQLPIIDW